MTGAPLVVVDDVAGAAAVVVVVLGLDGDDASVHPSPPHTRTVDTIDATEDFRIFDIVILLKEASSIISTLNQRQHGVHVY